MTEWNGCEFNDNHDLKTQSNKVMNVKQIYYISLLKMLNFLEKEIFIAIWARDWGIIYMTLKRLIMQLSSQFEKTLLTLRQFHA